MNHLIRLVTDFDSEAILSIYAPYITNTAISFEMDVPTISEFSNRIENISKQYPYLVYLIDKQVIGYAYASRHRERAAYNYDVDTSIYVLPEYHGFGIANKLYDCLFEILKQLGYYNAYAGITVPNEKSENFHKKYGFIKIGTHHKTGYKFNRWHDVIWFEKVINENYEEPRPIKSINELSEKDLNEILLLYTKK